MNTLQQYFYNPVANYFSKPVEESKPETKTDLTNLSHLAYGSASIVVSTALYSLSIASGYAAVCLLGVVSPLGVMFSFYSATLAGTYAINKIALPLWNQARGIETQEAEQAPKIERNYSKALGHLAQGILTSLAIWSFAAIGSMLVTGTVLRLAMGRAFYYDLGTFFWIAHAPIAAGFFTIPAIQKVATPHFEQAKNSL